jgi:Putative Flp pilus-assembly TadE/G-like
VKRGLAERGNERGQTIILVAFSMFALLAMAAIAIDVANLYVARHEAQQAADAAALAGAKAFVTSGFTSGNVTTATAQSMASNAALAAGQQLSIGGRPLISSELTVSPSTTNATNPYVTVTVARTNLQTFFAKIWGVNSAGVRASATAEAYNPSGGTTQIQVSGVKPWLIPNCDPNHTTAPTNPNCPVAGGNFSSEIIDPATGNLVNPSQVIGQSITLSIPNSGGQLKAGELYALSIPATSGASTCPYQATSPAYCSGPPGPFYDDIACFNPTPFSCGQAIGGSGIPLDLRNNGSLPSNLKPRMYSGVQCLIHQGGTGTGQDIFAAPSFGNPILIQPGANNPDPSVSSATYVSRSDSVVNIPIFDGTDLCPGGTCTGSTTVIGFLQLGIQSVNSNGQVTAYILNSSGCNPSMGPRYASGGGVSSIPVRLIQAP